MSKLELVFYPNPILDKKCEPVVEFNQELDQLVRDMILTMHVNKGIGLAAPQVGISSRILVFGGDTKNGVNEGYIINPEIVASSDQTVEIEEGCLSFPNLTAKVRRRTWVHVEGKNTKREPIELKADGLFAIVLQHEMDHLQGITFLQHISKLKRDIMKKKMEKFKKMYAAEKLKQLFLEEIKKIENAKE